MTSNIQGKSSHMLPNFTQIPTKLHIFEFHFLVYILVCTLQILSLIGNGFLMLLFIKLVKLLDVINFSQTHLDHHNCEKVTHWNYFLFFHQPTSYLLVWVLFYLYFLHITADQSGQKLEAGKILTFEIGGMGVSQNLTI